MTNDTLYQKLTEYRNRKHDEAYEEARVKISRTSLIASRIQTISKAMSRSRGGHYLWDIAVDDSSYMNNWHRLKDELNHETPVSEHNIKILENDPVYQRLTKLNNDLERYRKMIDSIYYYGEWKRNSENRSKIDTLIEKIRAEEHRARIDSDSSQDYLLAKLVGRSMNEETYTSLLDGSHKIYDGLISALHIAKTGIEELEEEVLQ